MNHRAIAICALVGAAVSMLAIGARQARSADAPPLVVARVKDVVGLDPSHQDDGNSLTTTALVFQNLVRFKPGSFQVEPGIARSWKSGADGKTWTFDLRPGLRFSDGTPLDAAAVKFNFDRWRRASDPTHGSFAYPYWTDMFGGTPGIVRDVDVNSSTKITFVLATPLGPFLRDLAMPSFAIGSPTAIRNDPKAFEQAPIGSGPYRVAEWVRNDHVTLTANPFYGGAAPVYKRVIIRDIPDQSTSVLSLEKGDIDGLLDPRPDDIGELAKQPGLRVYDVPSNNLMYLALNVQKAPFADVRVRRAIAYAIDKAAIARNFFAGGAVVADNWTPPGMLGENPAIKAYRVDLARSRTLLAQAGVPNGFPTELFYPASPRPYMPEPQRVAEAIQADLRKIGVNVTLQPFELAVFLQHVREGDDPMCLIGWTGDNGDPDNFLYPLLDQDSAVKGSAQNYSFWKDASFHKLMLAGQRTTDEAERKKIYQRANAMVHDQVPAIGLSHSNEIFVMKSSIANVIGDPDSTIEYALMRPADHR